LPHDAAAPEAAMNHGSADYFAECARFERRVSAITCALSAILLAPLLASYSPLFRERADRLREDLRFGVAGDQARYVRRIILEAAPGRDNSLRDLGKVNALASKKGGDPRPRQARPIENERPEFRPMI